MAQPILQLGMTGWKRYGRPKVSARVPRPPNDEVEKFPNTPSETQSSDWSVLADQRHRLRMKYAGNGGFQVDVKQNTDLKGAILASTADAGKNSLTTGTLTTSDIENKAEYSSSSSTIAGSFTAGKSMPDVKDGDTLIKAHTERGNGNLLRNGVNTLAATAAGNAQKPIEGNAAGTTRSAIVV